jgi:hypothetical protein
MNRPLSEVLPEVAQEVAAALKKEGRDQLAQQVSDLRLHDRCRCGDAFCAMFYTAPPPQGAWGTGHENIPLDPDDGMMILDVVNMRIVAVELLYRDDVRKRLLELLP